MFLPTKTILKSSKRRRLKRLPPRSPRKSPESLAETKLRLTLMLRLLPLRRRQISSSVAKAADHADGLLLLSVSLRKRRRRRRRKLLSKLLPPSLAASAALAPRLLTRRSDLCQKLKQRALVAEATKVADSRANVSSLLLSRSSNPSKRAGIDQLVVVTTETEDEPVLLMSTTWVVKFLATRTDAPKLLLLSMIDRMVVMVGVMELAKVVVPTTSAEEITLTRLAKATATCPTSTPIEIPISLNTTVAPRRLVVVDVVAKGSAVGETSPALATSQPLDAPRDQTSWLTTSAAIRTSRDGTEEPSASQVDGVGARTSATAFYAVSPSLTYQFDMPLC